MKKDTLRIEIVATTNVRLSSMSKESRDAALLSLKTRYKHVSITLVSNEHDLEQLVARRPDVVFLGMKYIETIDDQTHISDKLWLAGYLDEHEILHTGSGNFSHELELDKTLAKSVVLDAGLETSQFVVVTQQNQNDIVLEGLEFPLFVKPTNRGGGLGVDENSVVRSMQQLTDKVESLRKNFQCDALVEKYLPGREFSVSLLRDPITESYIVMPIELFAPSNDHGDKLLSSSVKSANAEVVKLPLMDGTIQAVTELAQQVFSALGARDYGRVDIRLDENGKPFFLEANLLPSLIEDYGSFAKSCKMYLGLSHAQMLSAIVELCLHRQTEDFEKIVTLEPLVLV